MAIMPNVVGMNFVEAQNALTADAVYIPVPSYGFVTPQITVKWQTSGQPPGLVVSQYPASGADVNAGAAITLTMSTFPMASVIE